jgi:hypothetical protein
VYTNDAIDRKSFENIRRDWIKSMGAYVSTATDVLLIGNEVESFETSAR